MKLKGYSFLLLVILLSTSCKKNEKPKDGFVDNFDRTSLLQNIGNSIIIPNYLDLKNTVDSLYNFAQAFNTNPSTTTLSDLKTQYLITYKSWLHCSVFEFGPAANVGLRLGINTFPLDTNKVNTNINNGTWSLAQASNSDAIGLPAIDYLLYGSDETTTITNFSSSTSRQTYLTDVIVDIQNRVNSTYSGWITSGGNYISTFIASTSSSAGSSLSYLVNQINYDYEILKNPRIGIPLGKRSLNVALPEKCEAVYSSFSLVLAYEHVCALQNIFNGNSKSGTQGVGLDDYLNYLNAQSNGSALTASINTKFNEVKSALLAIPEPLSDAVINNTALVETAYLKILEGLILLKTEMPSALTVLITYADNDGD